MRKLSKLFAGAVTMAAAAALVAGTVGTASAAPNDPPKGVAPKAFDIVAVGSNTTQYVLDAIAAQYDKGVGTKHSAAHPFVYSWDAVPLGTSASVVTHINPKAGCATIIRPNGSGAGVTALDTAQKITVGGVTYPCIDFSRSSGGRKPTDPAFAKGGIAYVAFARDAITWATRTAAKGGSDAPKSLTPKQLQGIFSCKTTNWSQVGGKPGAIKVYLPQAGSGTLSTWEKFMNITTLGSCVSQAPEENEGGFKGFNSPNAVFIYSVGAYIAQKYHSAGCHSTPTATQNKFGCNVTGVLGLGNVNGVSPLTTAKVPVINHAFQSTFWRTVYNVVPFATGTADHISKKLEGILGKNGFLCKSGSAKAIIQDYGFVNYPLCGSTS
jgi:ABC-type phosphate transport system substrate-binding protein